MSLYDLSYQSNEGKTVSLKEYEGKTMILVNTASKCGFTPQYEGLEKLYKTYREQGLVITGFPCNQFNEQEPGNNKEIEQFCKLRYGITFPLSVKTNVPGEQTHPIFKHLEDNTKFEGFGSGLKSKALQIMLKAKYGASFFDSSVKWNFTKFLVNKKSKIVGRFEPTTAPEKMEAAVKACL